MEPQTSESQEESLSAWDSSLSALHGSQATISPLAVSPSSSSLPSSSLNASPDHHRRMRRNFSPEEAMLVSLVTQRNPIISFVRIIEIVNGNLRRNCVSVSKKLRDIGTSGGDHGLAVRLRHTGERWRRIRAGWTFWDPPDGWDGSEEEPSMDPPSDPLQASIKDERSSAGDDAENPVVLD
ncbi:hypothetical protein PVAG01_07007 [Phlyctema vagabunda]|uniref:Uncharacterized protein n=1 Tax=Phlyctema vagabunda TaxID=108571 RepID=A0ABR4PBM8_9HELO